MRTALSRRVSMSVGVVLAVAAAGPLVAPAATAAPAPTAAVAPAAETATAPIKVPFLASGGELVGAGKTGFLTRDADRVVRWTRYADGVSKVIGEGATVHGSASDSVAVSWPKLQRYGTEKAMVYDMATGAAPVTFNGFSGYVTGAVGAALFDDGWAAHPVLSTQVGSVRTFNHVVGMTEGSESQFSVADSLPGTALGYYQGTQPVTPRKLVVVDIAGARVTDTYTVGEGATFAGGASISADRVDWAESVDGKTVLASAKRGSAEVTRVPLTGDGPVSFQGSLGGGWFVLGEKGDSPATGGIVARSLTDGTSFKLLDHAESVMKAADGTLLAIGTTADRGTGVYRLAVKDGKPSAELIAATGEPPAPTTPITYTGHAVPAVLNLDGVAKTRMSWKFSTTRADLSIELRYKKSWPPFRTTVRPRTSGTGVFPDGSIGIDWAGERGWNPTSMEAAPNGAYEWTVTARPWNGMPSVTATGTFEVTRTPNLHDYEDNGSPDLFARRTDGDLDAIDTRWDDATGRLVAGTTRGSVVYPGDWNAYDRVEAVGDIAGSTAFDAVTRSKAGVLWLHVGDPSVSKGPVKVGGGWDTYTQFTGGSDLTGDGRADLVAVDKVGDLYLYKATGSVTAPYAPRVKTGWGWGIYHQITAVGNVAGGPAGDLVARDNAGVLWLYLGKGDGTYASRVKIGPGWNEYTDLVGIGDANKDGRPDLYVRTTGTGKSYFYAGTGSWRAPFAPRAATQVAANDTWATYNQVF
ncbi:VCBS repeat-containing protein [Streptomyces sp. NBC_01077]|uniref:FG-GAP repeat domain-containing protein n=1 Tax=Streptomyces sp. NBC_01077 TaxID=2903746 RepID=UPI00386D41F4|nr:VCBS repeat-containing protein [Streptomyces sp. NBC_01077]